MRIPFAIASYAAALACAAAGPKSPPGPSPAPDKGAEIASLFEREIGPLPQTALVSSNGKTKASVEAKGPPTVKAQGAEDKVEIAFGATQPIACELTQSRIDGASSVANFVARIKASLEIKPMKPIDVEMAGENPVLFSEYAYFMPGEGGKKNVGHVKLAVVINPRHSVLCTHDEPGYGRTFRRIVNGLAGSMVTSGEGDLRSDAKFAEVQIVKAGDQPVGYAEMQVWDAEGGGFIMRNYHSVVFPRGEDLYASDQVRQGRTDAAGMLENETFVSVVNGEIATKVTVERQGATNKYKYEGTQSGKPITGEFATANGLASEVLQAALVRDLVGKKTAQVEVDEYVASANPVGPVHTVYRKESPDSATISATSKTLKYSFVPDATGWPRHAEIPMGPINLTFDRAWTHGSL
jgi:hypothetical protein